MKSRSVELLTEADRFLRAARVLRDAGIPENAAAEAYRAMFCAARAALSEVDREARTHKGVWVMFDQHFIRTDLFDAGLRDAARRAQELREDSDYREAGATAREAAGAIESADRFVTAVRTMFEG